MRGEAIFVYMMASGYNGSVYVGVTSDLFARIVQHRCGMFDGHTRRYGIKRLVYFEEAATLERDGVWLNRHCEERSDAAIQRLCRPHWIASPRSQ